MDSYLMVPSLLDSGEMIRMVFCLNTCVNSIPLMEKQELAEVTMNMFVEFVYRGTTNDEKVRLVAVPGLLSSLANLCGEETLLKNSHHLLIQDISLSVIYLVYDDIAAVLVDAGWTHLLVKALQARPDDEMTVGFVVSAIWKICDGFNLGKTAFLAAGVMTALEESIQRCTTDRE
mmetsp:Transcript_4291/g.6027  ORF Transcript_4291/g.6027 Transcript_4291/m.6027 type:complete len:175 (-) Transcript_4291:128-652(-)